MPLIFVAIAVIALFAAAYFTYGRYVSSHFDLRDDRITPAHACNDGVDYAPAEKKFLLGQHFSAIAAAGPIVGPILAALWFGWFPVLLWISLGSVFLGAVHDFASLAGSVRHGAASIVELVKKYLGKRGYLSFLAFVWLSLLYVITAFTDLTANSFSDPELGGPVATASMAYLAIGLAMGLALRARMKLAFATPFFLLLAVLAIWFSQYAPLSLPAAEPRRIWNALLILYCFAASLAPVWLLLQPRGYLGGFFLYGTLAAGLVGLFLGGEKIAYPAFTGFTAEGGQTLFPLLFVTVACGACSGFHGIVCSGTTSKQISKENDCRLVGYGGMLLEGVVALVALSTVMVLAKPDALVSGSPDRIYAEGLSRFVSNLGIPRDLARSFALLAFTTFIYDTLDVATRLARYIFQELTGWKGIAGKIGATVMSLVLPLVCVSLTMRDASGAAIPAWKLFWTIFGTSNQLLAGLTLLVLSVWLKKAGKSWWLSGAPAAFMLLMTFWSLGILAKPFFGGVKAGLPGAVVALVLMGLSVFLVVEACRAWKRPSGS